MSPLSAHLLLAIHGSRDATARRQADVLCKAMESRNDWLGVEVGWLQFLNPTVEEALENLVASGARRIVVAPLFILSGRHVDCDLPAIVADMRRRRSDCDIHLGGPLVAAEGFIVFLADHCRALSEAAPTSGPEPPDATDGSPTP